MIKKFNEYNGYSNDDYYKEIPEEQYNSQSTKMWDNGELTNPDPIEYLEFTEREVSKINATINKREKNFVMQYNCDIEYQLPSYMGGTAFTDDRKYHKYRLTIKKMRDNYYFVSIEKGLRNFGGDFRYYKCDGFQGLIKLLKDY